MKTKLYLAAFLLFQSLLPKAQNIENPGFDSAYIGGIDRIHSWITSDAWYNWTIDTVQPHTPNTHYVSVGLQYHELLQTVQLEYANAFEGALAIKLFSVNGKVRVDGNPYKGFITNGNHFYTDSQGYLDFVKGGTPFPFRPSKLRGHFKFDNTSPSLTNFGKARILLKKYNSTLQQIDTVAYAESTMQFYPTANWTAFELPLVYQSNQTPDSVVLVFESSAWGLSSTFWLDSLGFYYPNPSAINEFNQIQKPLFFHDVINHSIELNKEVLFREIKLYNSIGKIVHQGKENDFSISIDNLYTGIYFLELETASSGRKIYKILVSDASAK